MYEIAGYCGKWGAPFYQEIEPLTVTMDTPAPKPICVCWNLPEKEIPQERLKADEIKEALEEGRKDVEKVIWPTVLKKYRQCHFLKHY